MKKLKKYKVDFGEYNIKQKVKAYSKSQAFFKVWVQNFGKLKPKEKKEMWIGLKESSIIREIK